MATQLETLQFELERRVIIFTPNTTLQDLSLLEYNANPNDASSGAPSTGGEYLLYASPNSTRYAQFDSSGNILQEWFKQGQPNTWVKMASGDSGGIASASNVGAGDVSIFYNQDNTDLEFRTISGGSGIKISSSDNVITIDASGSGNYDTILDDALTMPYDVGGIPADTSVGSLKGDALINLWNNLLFPTVNPTFEEPFNTFSIDVPLIQSISSIIDLEFTSEFDRGAIMLNGVEQNYRSGLPEIYQYTDPSGNTLLPDTTSTLLSDVQDVYGYKVVSGEQTFSNDITYSVGPQPLNNKGESYSTPSPASITGSLDITIEGVLPMFGTINNIYDTDELPLFSILHASYVEFTLVADIDDDKKTFQIPSDKMVVTEIQTYNPNAQQPWVTTDLNEWEVTYTTKTINGEPNINYANYKFIKSGRQANSYRLFWTAV